MNKLNICMAKFDAMKIVEEDFTREIAVFGKSTNDDYCVNYYFFSG